MVSIISNKKLKIVTLSMCSLLFRQMRLYAVFFHLAELLSHMSFTSAATTTSCNQIIPDHKNQTPVASTASRSLIRNNGKATMSTITAQIYHKNICCSLLRCIRRRSTYSIRRFIDGMQTKRDIYYCIKCI